MKTDIERFMIEPFGIMLAIQPDIIGVSWNGDDFEIITANNEKMSDDEFEWNSMTRSVMETVGDVLSINKVVPFSIRHVRNTWKETIESWYMDLENKEWQFDGSIYNECMRLAENIVRTKK